ncbi:MAG: asparagine synthase-related protein, partial [Bryobacteraceae bacterium]
PQPLRRALSVIADRLPYSAYGKNYLRTISRSSALERYLGAVGMPYFLRKELLEPQWMLPDGSAFLARALAGCLLPNGADILSQALYFEATAKLTGDMLTKVDRMSMANSLEIRCPLLDHELAEMASGIAPDLKLRDGKGKYIFVQAMRDRLPAELLSREKMGFGVPLARWFRTSLKEFLWDHLTDPVFLNRGIVSPPFVRSLLEEHDTGRRNHYHFLWTLLMLELWFREWTPAMQARPSVTRLS